ncbi:MAG: CotH kinase family protein [Flavobacteriales bacterium]|nr:CotH kinase family protein [Flavobacteriales bacterium]
MRCAFALFLQLTCSIASAQNSVLLNEVLPGNQGITTDSAGHTPDWIELFNPSSKEIDLNGWRIAMAGRQHVFTASLVVPAKGYRTVWCDGRTNDGTDHIAFRLAREGGALLLIAPDGMTIADVFSYPVVRGNVSIGRYPDGEKAWSYFTEPTPSARNWSETGMIKGPCQPPSASNASGHYNGPFEVELRSDDGTKIRYTVDGSAPTQEHGTFYNAPIPVETSTTIRAIAMANGHLPSDAFCATYNLGDGSGEALALSLSPADLWDDSTGIYTTGVFNNNTRSGKDWERSGVAEWIGAGAMDVGVRISGSGSRGARKRSFKLYARDGSFPFADSTHVDEGLLRADAGAHSFLRNTTLEELVRRYDLHLAMQPSRAVPLYLNAAYWGLYRWMPAKDGDWLKQVSGAEAVDLLEGPAAVALNGNNNHFLRAQELLLHGAPLDSTEALFDVQSLIDLACIDLWTGRADHDLNVRCYRPRQAGGRWRWVLFDMDLWAPAEENSAQRMALAAAPETPFIPQLLAHADLQERLLARIIALQAAVFSKAGDVADSIHRAHEPELLADFRRWELELDLPHPDSSLAALQAFTLARPQHLFTYLARLTGRKLRTVTVEAPTAEHGQLLIDGLPLSPGKHEVRCFSGVALEVEVRAVNGVEFADWKGLDLEGPKGSVDLSRGKNVRAVFRALVP